MKYQVQSLISDSLAIYTKAPIQELVRKNLASLLGDLLARQFAYAVVAEPAQHQGDTQYRLTLNVLTDAELEAYVLQRIERSNNAKRT